MTKIYHAEIFIVSRGATRKGYHWSTGQIRSMIQRMGYEIVGANPNKGDTQELQLIKFSGTRDEVIAARKDIELALRVVSGGGIYKKFNVVSN